MSVEPEPELLARAGGECARIARTTGRITLGCAAVGVAALALALAEPAIAGPVVAAAGGAGVFGAIYGVAWSRARAAAAGVASGPYARVHAIGWARPPDGCNYGLFPGEPPPGAEPAWVVRLPISRRMATGPAWLCGAPRPSFVGGGVALVDARDGSLLGTGRVVGERTARRRWARRAQPPGRLVSRPPEDWVPPGGE